VLDRAGWRVFVFLVLLSVPAWTEGGTITYPSGAPGGLIVWGDAYYRKASDIDPGTIHLFLENKSNASVEVIDVLLDGQSLHNAQGKSIYWYHIVPNPIPASTPADIMIKLISPLSKPVKVEVITDKSPFPVARIVEPEPLNLHVSYVAFSDDYQKAYVYVRNDTDVSLRISQVRAFPVTISEISFVVGPLILPGQKACLVVRFSEQVKRAQYILLRVDTEQSIRATHLVRAYTYFPIQAFGQDHRATLSFDAVNFDMHYPPTEADFAKTIKEPWFRAYHLVDDPACRDAAPGKKLGSTALEVIKRQQICWQKDPLHPTIIYICQFERPLNYFIYGELTDLIAIDPYPIVLDHESPFRNAHWVSFAKKACEPRPLYTIPEAFHILGNEYSRYPTPEELRLTVYLQIAYGSKGIWYYTKNAGAGGYEANPLLEAEIGKVNAELRKLRPYLKIGEPAGLGKANSPNVAVHTILAGDEGIVVLVINNQCVSLPFAFESEQPFTFEPQKNINVQLTLPPALAVGSILAIDGDEEHSVPFAKRDDIVTFSLPHLSTTKQLLIIP